MKKFIFVSVICLLFGALCFAVVPDVKARYTALAATTIETTVEAETPLNEETEEVNYFREKVMPYITANLSGILSGLLAMLLTLGKIKAATTELKASTSENSCLKKKNKQLEERIAKLEAKVEAIDKNTQDTKEMVKIGFCNTSELVINGYAEKIAKVGENEEETES